MSAGSGTPFPWLRRIEVSFEGLKGGGSRGPFIATGKTDAYNIRATVNKSIMGIPEASRLDIYNLSKDTRASFVRNETKVRIKAGWDEGPFAGLKQCFYGQVLSATSKRQGTDIVTSISSISAIETLASSYVSGIWVSIPVEIVVRELANYLRPDIDDIQVVGVTGKIGEGGWSFAGLVKNGLMKLAEQYKFSWCIVDGKFQAVGDKASLGAPVVIQDPYLIEANPLVSGPLQYTTGVAWKSAFMADLRPGGDATIKSLFDENSINGTYRVNEIVHYLDCHAKYGHISSGWAHMLGKKS